MVDPLPPVIPPPIEIPTTLQAVINSTATRLVASAGAAIVTHGIATQDIVNQAVDPVSQILAGAIVFAVGIAWGWIRSARKNNDARSIITDPRTSVPPEVGKVK